MPVNTPCTIIKYCQQDEHNIINIKYHVRFIGKFVECGDYIISHLDLKIG